MRKKEIESQLNQLVQLVMKINKELVQCEKRLDELEKKINKEAKKKE